MVSESYGTRVALREYGECKTDKTFYSNQKIDKERIYYISKARKETTKLKGTIWNSKYGCAIDGGVYNKANSFTNRYGVKYKLYDQTLWPWSSLKYGDGKLFDYKWCMLTAAAVITSSLNYQITPTNFFNKKYRHEYVYNSIPKYSSQKIKSYRYLRMGSDTNRKVVENLKKGNPAIIKVVWGKKGESKFTWDQHYLALLDVSNDWKKIYVGNSHISGASNEYAAHWWYPTNEVLKSVNEATTFYRA